MGVLLAKVASLEAEVQEMKGMLARVLALLSATPHQTQMGDVITGPSPLLQLPVEVPCRLHPPDAAPFYWSLINLF